jgi:hypothetical protein
VFPTYNVVAAELETSRLKAGLAVPMPILPVEGHGYVFCARRTLHAKSTEAIKNNFFMI